jgi:hypothetical protein
MHFYIYLPSNVICEHAGNTAASYIVPLNPPIELKHNNFEVALVEISHPSVDMSDFTTKIVGGGEKKNKVKNKTVPSLMFIYCSVVKGITVGNACVPLLRACTVKFSKESSNTNTNLSFAKPFYQPIACQFIDKIEITISSQTGDSFPFKSGISLACLHFRENKPK